MTKLLLQEVTDVGEVINVDEVPITSRMLIEI